jgi:hypothetical protein
MTHLRARVGADFWDLLSLFFGAWRSFRETHETYETKVIQYAEERGVDRRLLRLSDEEVSGLLELRKLEQLRNDMLGPLKTISHRLFRVGTTTDPLDRTISQIFHELSILKEEQYKISTFAPEFKARADQQAYESILDEVHEAFPRQVHGIFELFEKAQSRIEQLLAEPQYARDKVTLRSVFLFGDETFRGLYPNGAEDILEIMFPAGGAAEGYLVVAKSFLESGFREYAIEALERALKAPAPLAVRTDGAPAGAHAAVRRDAEEMLRELKDVSKRRAPAATAAGGGNGGAGPRA